MHVSAFVIILLSNTARVYLAGRAGVPTINAAFINNLSYRKIDCLLIKKKKLISLPVYVVRVMF